MAVPRITRSLRLSSSRLPLLRSGRAAVHSAADGFIDARGTHALAVAAVERILRYSFREKSLLAEALTHPSHPARPSYDDRLREIGQFALSTSLSHHHRRRLNPDRAISLLAKEMSSARLAIMAVNHDLYRYLRRNDPALDRSVADFASVVEKLEEGLKIEDVLPASGGVVFPRVLEHVVMSVAGAVHLDCGSDLEVFLKKIGSFWEPLVG